MTGSGIADKRLNQDCNLHRGCGGVWILWDKRLNVSTITGIDSDRIYAITIETTYAPILVIGVYLPTTDYPTEDFLQCLHTIEELVNKHGGPVILAGDFNSHVGKDGGPRAQGNQNPHGKLLLELVHNNDMYITSLSNISTYFRDNVQTTTDYIIADAIHAPQVSCCYTHDTHPLNSSDHLPLSVTLSLSPTFNPHTSSQPKLNWSTGEDDGSTLAYAAAVSEIIRPILGKSYSLITDLDTEICQVTNAVLSAASSTIPKKKSKRPTK